MSEFGLVIIGAHIGIHINKDLEEYKNQKVILIEPVPHNLKALKTNTRKYKNIFIEPVTIGNKNENRDNAGFKAYCFARNGVRSFRHDRILSLTKK